METADDRRSEASEAFERRYLEQIANQRLVELLAEYETAELIALLERAAKTSR